MAKQNEADECAKLREQLQAAQDSAKEAAQHATSEAKRILQALREDCARKKKDVLSAATVREAGKERVRLWEATEACAGAGRMAAECGLISVSENTDYQRQIERDFRAGSAHLGKHARGIICGMKCEGALFPDEIEQEEDAARSQLRISREKIQALTGVCDKCGGRLSKEEDKDSARYSCGCGAFFWEWKSRKEGSE